MKETIYTIPINEAFDRRDGCPMCELSRNLEQSSLEYIMGAAMMEPDVRLKTNEQGFCHRHLQFMLGENNKLSLALMLESHLPELDKTVFDKAINVSGKKSAGKLRFLQELRVHQSQRDDQSTPDSKPRRDLQKVSAAARAADNGCYICGRVSVFMRRYYENMLHMWKNELDFREKFNSQPYFCVPHYADLVACAEDILPRNRQPVFIEDLSRICGSYLKTLNDDISEFCKSFDYRFAGRDMSAEARDAVERAARFLTGG